ncbi:uncharacterized protein STEHIDRAFT_142334 [Stereum hirsutum FP-91666 SS1]|uniref:uncharacterized protein n=1 Tax=Stereum hirsutum (strain FP-91666) TaxID=721885 RepID=UPI000444A4CA|nr:uncharacterized protein STEHIDRAFT_142334 [Stereum hirsutum FP-91666 SS1]EIM81028.1 hypothetical protein STEHIDRAFT_142334 [Stereum hirsutum FP-91666 SS1]
MTVNPRHTSELQLVAQTDQKRFDNDEARVRYRIRTKIMSETPRGTRSELWKTLADQVQLTFCIPMELLPGLCVMHHLSIRSMIVWTRLPLCVGHTNVEIFRTMHWMSKGEDLLIVRISC